MRAIQRFGQQLQRLRTRRGLTQEQLAVKAGLVRVYVSKLELGEQRSDVDDAGAIGEGAEGLGDGVVRRERECESVVAGGGGSLCDARGGRGLCPQCERNVYRTV